jgi:hypothetical protein
MTGTVASGAGPYTWRRLTATPRCQSSAIPMNTRSTPARVGEAHLPNQIANFRRYRWATFITTLTLPIPIQSEAFAVPGDNSFRFDKEQRRSPVVPQTGEPSPQGAVSPTETELMPTARTLQDQELMPESENLCLQNSASSETISQREE